MFKDMTDEQLKELALSRYSVVYDSECYSPKDLMNLDGALGELENRGYKIRETYKLIITKGD